MQIMLMLFTGVAAGVLSGMFGIGGGLVIVPALVLIMGFFSAYGKCHLPDCPASSCRTAWGP